MVSPQRKSGELFSEKYLYISYDEVGELYTRVKSTETLDLKKHTGFISWSAKILSPKSKENFSLSTKSNEWLSPRQTDSNLVKIGSEVEKYIFYRGIASFSSIIKAKLENRKFLNLKNSYTEKIPFVFILDSRTKEPKFWEIELDKEETKKIDLKDNSGKLFTKETKENFVTALISSGLYKKEAIAMMNTWNESYFKTKGISIFYIVPENLINALLPLEFNKSPDELKRVFIGRVKI